MTRDGFLLTLPDGTEFASKTEVETTLEQDIQYIFNGFRESLSLIENYITDDRGGPGEGMGQAVTLGSGARIQRITVEFEHNIDSSEPWGSTSAGESAVTKRDALNRSLETLVIDSGSPATLAWGEYSDTGQYAPKAVALTNSRLPSGLGQGASSFRGTLEFVEVADLGSLIHGANRTE
jgi:hypothetical protein